MDVGVRDELMKYALRQNLKRSIDQCREFNDGWETSPPQMNAIECKWLWRADFNKETEKVPESAKIIKPTMKVTISFF